MKTNRHCYHKYRFPPEATYLWRVVGAMSIPDIHADAEAVLLENGSRQADLWGANYYPGLGASDCIEYTSLINIRPSEGNRSMVIEDGEIRDRVEVVTHRLLGKGEALP